MTLLFARRVFLLGTLMLSCITTQMAVAKELLVFISAFAGGNDGALHACQLDLTSGQLKLIQRTTDIQHPFFLAIAPNKKFLYAIHAPGEFGGKADEQIAAYELIGTTGQLKLLNRQSTRGTASCYVDVDSESKTVVVANYKTGSVASYSIAADGSLGEIATFVQHRGSSVDKSRQEGPHAHCMVISPDNQYAYAADLGLDQIVGYRLNPRSATLSASQQPYVRTLPGAGPRHLTFHPNGERMYVINELANSITYFGYDFKTGILIEKQTISTLPADFTEKSYCADLKITPNGRFLYGTNRGHDSIAAYRIADDGQLTLSAIVPSLGKGPQNLAITPDGAWLLCANMPGNNVAVFRIDADTGAITPTGTTLTMPSPSCIRILK